MKSVLLSIFSLLVIISMSHAQTQNEPRIDNKMKIQFTAPVGWKISKKDDGYLMGSPHTSGFMLIKVQDFDSIISLKSAMESGILLEDGSKLLTDGDLNLLGDMGVSGMYLGAIDGTEMRGFLMALMPPSEGRAVICISVAPADIFNQSNMDELKTLLRSVVFL
jgi:hypothetical protein